MLVEQTSIFLENKVGRLAEVTKALADNDINIKALSLADTSEFGILRLIVSDPAKARQALKECGFTVGSAQVVAVEVPHAPGGLHSIVQLMGESSINIEYMYGFPYMGNNAVMIFRFDQPDAAVNHLKEINFRILPHDEVYG